ncbi:MAG: hypothetical protein H6605_02345 [Flavobacteriales bacterium]|nr:hypothetical protein [Flavobacteriales bacterium]
MNQKNNLILFAVLILATFSRLFISIPNFTAIGALALFCGANVSRQKYSMLIPFTALLAGDLMLAGTGKLYSDYFVDGYFLFVYFAFAITWLLGRRIRNSYTFIKVVKMSVLSSVLFFLITNFGSWMQMPFYPKTIAGLGEAYAAGLVFYKGDALSNFFLNQVAGDLFFNLLFFAALSYFIKKSEDLLTTEKVRS